MLRKRVLSRQGQTSCLHISTSIQSTAAGKYQEIFIFRQTAARNPGKLLRQWGHWESFILV